MNLTGVKIATATSVSLAANTVLNLDGLYSALITLGIAVVTEVGFELVKYLVALIQSKKAKLDSHTDEKSDKE